MADDKLPSALVMTPQLQQAIKLLSMSAAEVVAMVDEWIATRPGVLVPGDPGPSDEELYDLEEQGIPVWTFLEGRPLIAVGMEPDVWVFGNPPEARANPNALPLVRVADGVTGDHAREGKWLARSLRQRAKTYEKIVASVMRLRPEAAIALEPERLKPLPVREVAELVGMHESTIQRVATNCRYQTIHGIVQLSHEKTKLVHRALDG